MNTLKIGNKKLLWSYLMDYHRKSKGKMMSLVPNDDHLSP
jgi:hypothetical protein